MRAGEPLHPAELGSQNSPPSTAHPLCTCGMARDGAGPACFNVTLFSRPPSCTCHGASLPQPPPASSAPWSGLSRVGSTPRAPVLLQGGVDSPLLLSGGESRLYWGRTLCTASWGPSQTQQAFPQLLQWAMFPAQCSGLAISLGGFGGFGLPMGLEEADGDVGGEKTRCGEVMLMDQAK